VPSDPAFNRQILADQRFFEQRRHLPDNPIVDKSFSRARWQISIQPSEFMEAQLKDLRHCEDFIQHNAVRARGFPGLPCVNPAAIQQDPAGKWIAGEVDHAPNPPWANLERWVLFRSGLFLHNRGLVEHEQLEKNLHYLEVIRLVTQVFRLAARMANEGIVSPRGTIRIKLHNIAGRGLLVPDIIGSFWAQQDAILTERVVTLA